MFRGIMALKEENSGEGAEFFHAEMLDPVDEIGGRAGRVREGSIIPVGIFLMLFFIEAAVAAGVSLAYFIHTGSSGIREIESYVRSYSLPLADELSAEAGASLKKKDFSRVRSLLREKADEGLIDEGFLLLNEGGRAVHVANRSGEESPGNRWSHSAELILSPARRKSRETAIIDYSVPFVGLPFVDDIRLPLKRFFYSGIDSNAWLVTRAVFQEGKPEGAVGFIIGKQKIYTFLESHIRFTLRILAAGLGAALAISLVVSFVVFLRYRSLRRGGAGRIRGGGAAHDEFYDVPLPAVKPASPTPADNSPFSRGTGIRDAIPVHEKE